MSEEEEIIIPTFEIGSHKKYKVVNLICICWA